MFTGIIEETGVLKEQNGGNLVIQADKVLEDVHLGDSIAVNGVCLTVTEFQKTGSGPTSWRRPCGEAVWEH